MSYIYYENTDISPEPNVVEKVRAQYSTWDKMKPHISNKSI